MAPFFFVAFFLSDLVPSVNPYLYCALLVVMYIVMELTDLLDGKIARRRNLVTDLGKVLDPFADVICHLTFFTCLLASNIMPVWAYIFVLWREFAQSFTRMLMMGKGKAMAANIFGKAKTCLYALACICGFAYRILTVFKLEGSFWKTFDTVLLVLFALTAISSVASYLIYVRAIIKSKALSGMTR
jgi:CDP-diacylglycerol--glycerol-3-phosphate 3-phosphatidyltransferase